MPSSPSKDDPRWTLAHLMLLSRFSNPRATEPLPPGYWSDQWRSALGETHEDAIRRFVDTGLLMPCPLSQRLAWKLPYTELKRMLRDLKLKISGRKAEMAERLCESDPEGMEKVLAGLNLLQCSESGRTLASAFSARKSEIQNAALEALREKNLDLAVRTVSEFQDALGFPEDPLMPSKPDAGDLRRVFSVEPKILKGISDDVMESVRIAAGMAFLGLGTKWLPENLVTGARIDGDIAVDMVVSRVQTERNVESWQASGLVSSVEVVCSTDGPCVACSELSEHPWSIDTVPEIPYEHCTSAWGCHCGLILSEIRPRR